MKEKKEIKFNLVSFGLLIALLLLLVLSLLLGFSLYNTQKALENSKMSQSNTTNNQVKNNNETVDEVIEEDGTITEETNKGEEVDFTTPEIKKVLDKIDYDTPYLAGIYKQGNFNRETIPNDLILRLAFEKWSHNDYEKNGEQPYQKMSKEEMKEYVTNLFGKNIKYNDAPFLTLTVGRFDAYTEICDGVDYSDYDENYVTEYHPGGGGDRPFIHQQVNKVLKYDDKLEIYVKTVFGDVIGTTNDENYFIYEIYKNYNFKTDVFDNSLLEVVNEQFYDGAGYNKRINFQSPVLNDILDQIDTYVYTFEYDETANDYYLSEFKKAE